MKIQLVKLAILFIFFLACAAGFVALADEVFEGDSLQFDESVLLAIHVTSTNFWDGFYQAVTHLGGVAVVALATMIAVGYLIAKKKSRHALFVVSAVGGAALLNVVLKLIFERPRPDLWDQLIVETNFSFPSGHAMASMALAATAVVLFWNTKHRWWVTAISALYVLLIGYSRLYLGVHYPTDVLAGWLVSIAWVLLVASVLFGPRFLSRLKMQRA